MNTGIFKTRHVNTAANYYRCTWKIESMHECASKGSLFKSPLFTVPNRDRLKWYLSLQSIFFEDHFEKIASSVHLVLDRTSDCKKAFVKFNLYIDGRTKSIGDVQQNRTIEFDTKSENSQGSMFWSGRYSITFVCDLMIESVCFEDNSFANDYRSFLKSQQMSDVVLSVGEKKYPANKTILSARSTVFAAMFAHNMIENQGVVRIEGMGEDVVEEMLLYIYTGEIENLKDLAQDLLMAADKYDLNGLRIKCEEFLISSLSSSNVLDLLLLANLYNAKELKFEALNYLTTRNTKEVKSSAWENICQSSPELFRDISEAFVSSTIVSELKKNSTG